MKKNALYSTIIICSLIFPLFGCNVSDSIDRNNDKSRIGNYEIEQYEEQDSLLKNNFPKRWRAGTKVDSTMVSIYGIGRCFVADTISDSLFALMKDVTFHEDTPVTRSSLRYLKVLHYNSEGEIILGEMICNQLIASDLLEIFRDLFDAKYPIERMKPAFHYDGDDEASMTDNNTSCFNSRTITGSMKPSLHAFGLAVDINPLYNPYIKKRNGSVMKILPLAAKHTDKNSPYHIKKGDLCYRLFIAHGFQWGGSWQSVKDFQHFEIRR